jgi:iron complex outermembrane receptor protein
MNWHRKLCALAALSLGLALASTMTIAQQAQPAQLTIQAQDLGPALSQLGRESGREIIFSTEIVRGRRTAGVQSAMTVEAALTKLLAESGLGWRVNADGAILIERGEGTLSSEVVEEVMVTAQRREEQGQKVPVSVTAFGSSAIEAYRLERLRDVSRVTPGLLVSSFSQSSPTIAIRGASNTFTQIGANKPVAVVVDDVFIPRNSAADFDLFGLHSIQILRGPQGTLFGRNVTGGAILLDTGRPDFGSTAAKLRGTVGDYDAHAVDGLLDVAAGKNAAFRLAGSFREHDGYGRDRLTGRQQDDQDDAAIRGQARLSISPALEVLLGADYGEDKNGGRTLSSLGVGDDGNRRTSETGIAQRFNRTQKGGSARVSWDVAGGELTSISALRKSATNELYSNVGANYSFLTGTQSQLVSDDADDVRALSQEIRFASPLWNFGNFIAGVYYLDEDSSRVLRTQAFAARTGALVTNQVADQSVDSRSAAVFADGTLNLPANFNLTLGVRYTHDRKNASLTRTDAIVRTNDFTARDLEASWEEFTPRAILSWSPLTDLHAYFSFAKGYTAGGFNTEAATLAALTTPFNPETVKNYEVGVKSDWLAGRLRINVSAFRMQYQDKQELFFNNLTRILTITNAAEATSKGMEIETRLVAASWLTLNATYGLLDTNYDEFIIPGGAVYTGNPLSSSPHDKASLSAQVDFPLGTWGALFGTATYSSTSAYFTGASADANLRVPAYDLVNLSVGVAPNSGPWMVTAFVRNAGDTEYLLTPSTQTVRAEYLGEPRTVGVTLTWNF